MSEFPVEWVRSSFPALQRRVADQRAIFFDGPAGSQVPVEVADAVSQYLLNTNANHGAPFATARESDALLDQAHEVFADFFGTDDPGCVSFGANMTTITFALSRALARTWREGDEIIVSKLDHDANFTPWKLAARDCGVLVREVDVLRDDATLCMDSLRSALTERTRLVAVGYAANATGTVNPVARITELAHAAEAEVFIDAVHYAPHGLIDVAGLDCDYLVVSAYKFFGPHVGVLYGRRSLLEKLQPYKLRPSPDDLPGRWMTGTQNHEGIAGAAAAVEYLARLGRRIDPGAVSRRVALRSAYAAIHDHEQALSLRLMRALGEVPGLRIHGIADPKRVEERVPTFSVTSGAYSPQSLCERLGNQGIFTWAGNHYALPYTEAAGLEPEGTLRIGALHYNTSDEVDRCVGCLRSLL